MKVSQVAAALAIAVTGFGVLGACTEEGPAAQPKKPDTTVTITNTNPVPMRPSPPSTDPVASDVPANDDENVLSPDGLGALKLGMSEAEAEVTGLLDKLRHRGRTCSQYRLDGGGFADFSSTGLVRLALTRGDVRTPEGIRVGSSEAELKAAYPDLRKLSGRPYFTGPYNFSVQDGKVELMELFDQGGEGCAG